MEVLTNIPIITGEKYEVDGYFFNIKDTNHICYLEKDKNNKYRGISGIFENKINHENCFTGFFHKDYLEDFLIFLNNFSSRNGEKYFSKDEIKKIFRIEKIKDSKRGDLAPYIRTLIVSCLRKTGSYIDDFEYIGHTEEKYQKHIFWIKSFLIKRRGELDFFSTKSRKDIPFDSSLHREHKHRVKIFTEDVQNIRSNLNEIYVNSFKKAFVSFLKSLNRIEIKKKRKNINFIDEVYNEINEAI